MVMTLCAKFSVNDHFEFLLMALMSSVVAKRITFVVTFVYRVRAISIRLHHGTKEDGLLACNVLI